MGARTRKAKGPPPLPKTHRKARARRRARPTPPPLPADLPYLEESRDPATGFLFIVPLLLIYELGLVLLRSEMVNWAHGVVRLVFQVFGRAEPVLFAGVVAVLMALSLRRAHRLRIELDLYARMLAESFVYAGALGLMCSAAARHMLLTAMSSPRPGLAREIVLSVGAGVYEEFLFRVVVLGCVYYVLKRWAKLTPSLAAAAGILVSSLLFAACHHLGPYGEPFEMARVSYRFAMGTAFAAIYIYRGLGIVVYTHALYDVFVTLSQ